MPLYDYKCGQCGQVFEVRQSFSDEVLTTHEGGCGGPVERLISVPALQFKGSGFYITDYARGSGAGPASQSNGSKKEGSSSGSESKPASSSSSDSSSSSSSSSSGSSTSSDTKK